MLGSVLRPRNEARRTKIVGLKRRSRISGERVLPDGHSHIRSTSGEAKPEDSLNTIAR